MKKSRFTDEQIIGFLKQAEAGMPIKELCRSGGFSDATFYKWRAKYVGMEASDASKLRDLESENAKLKRFLAEAHSFRQDTPKNAPHGAFFIATIKTTIKFDRQARAL
jgi:putative transposase